MTPRKKPTKRTWRMRPMMTLPKTINMTTTTTMIAGISRGVLILRMDTLFYEDKGVVVDAGKRRTVDNMRGSAVEVVGRRWSEPVVRS